VIREVSWRVGPVGLQPRGSGSGHSHDRSRSGRAYPAPVQTRFLIIAALITALVILGASLVWFLLGVL